MLDDDRSGASARPAADDGAALAGLQEAVTRLRRELAAYRRLLPDRAVAEDELDALTRQVCTAARAPGLVDTERLRHSLLLVAAALGSVSALAAPLDALRRAVEEVVQPN